MTLRGIVAAVALLAGTASAVSGGEDETAEVGRPAPEIRVSDWIGGDGRSSLADFRGDVVLLVFFRTHCGTSRAEVGPLSRLQREEARRGLTVVGLTSDDRATLLRYMTHVDASFAWPVGIGSGPGYPARTLPFSALVGADGTLLWQGASGSLPRETLDRALRGVTKPTAEALEARAARALALAEALLLDRQYVRAEAHLRSAAERWGTTPSGRAAAALLPRLAADDVRAEVEAQRSLAKLLGGAERPSEADSKRARKLAKALEKKAEEWRESAPRASALAADWAAICAEPWK